MTSSSMPSEIISSRPMLAVPGWLDSHKRAKGRGRRHCAEDHSPHQARLQHGGLAGAPGEHEVDVEGDADAKQQRQGNDVGEIQRQVEGPRKCRTSEEPLNMTGSMVSTTSRTRRSTAASSTRNGQGRSRPPPAGNAWTIFRPMRRWRSASRSHPAQPTGPPARTAEAMRCRGRPSAGPAAGRAHPRPVQSAMSSRRQAFDGDGAGLQLGAHLVEHDLERRHHGRRRGGTNLRRGGLETVEPVSQTTGRGGGGRVQALTPPLAATRLPSPRALRCSSTSGRRLGGLDVENGHDDIPRHRRSAPAFPSGTRARRC